MSDIALLGGTFDPIHYGHIKPLLELAERLHWQQVWLQPCYQPPHRAPTSASNEHRLAMVRLAAELDPRLMVDSSEIEQQAPTRTIITLQRLHQQLANRRVFFIMGMDSLLGLPSWKDWRQLADYCHFIILPRPGYELQNASAELRAWLAERRLATPQFDLSHGQLWVADTSSIDISATALRQDLQQTNQAPDYLPVTVWQYIRTHQLYR